jgi:acylphosphatase
LSYQLTQLPAYWLTSLVAKSSIYEVCMEKQVRAHAVISGRVQGVFFRAETQRAAEGFGVLGWVRNNATLNWCRQGPRMARVDKVDVNWQDFTGEFKSFDITY